LATDSFLLTITAANLPPTLRTLSDVEIAEDGGSHTVSLSGITSGSTSESQNLTITAVSSEPSLIPNPAVSYSSPNTSGSLSFAPAANMNGRATITVTVNDGQTQNGTTSRSFNVTVNPANDAPTLNPIANIQLATDTPLHNIGLSGIGAGAPDENDSLTLSATSSDPSLVPDPTITYFSPNTTGSLGISPAAGASGTATITVTVDDGHGQNHVVVRTFTVTVEGSNTPPQISDIEDISISMNGIASSIQFTVGDAETAADNLRIVATSSNPALIWTNNIVINGTGSNRVANASATHDEFGFSVITFTVTDEDGAETSDSFVVTVVPPNARPTLNSLANVTMTEDSDPQVINLTGITDGAVHEDQDLIVTAVSSNPDVMPHPTVDYTSPDSTGTLTLAPAPNVTGSTTIIVTVNDGQSSDNLFTRTFGVLVNAVNDPPTITDIPNQVIDQNTVTPALPFVIDDAETPVDSLQLSASSSDQNLVPNGNIQLSGTGPNRSVTVTPALSGTGSSTITVSVSDGFQTTSTSFELAVGSGNTAPIVVVPASLETDSYTPITNAPLTVMDQESRPDDLTLTAKSFNESVLPSQNIVFGGSGSNRTVTLTPVPRKQGNVTITLTCGDGQAITRTSFEVSVVRGNSPKSKITVNRKGKGKTVPTLDGEELIVGASYKITAVPAEDELFIGWTGDLESTSPALSFTMQSNLVLECKFTNNPYLGHKGTYNGLFHETAQVRQESCGDVSIKATERGTYTSKLRIGKKRYSMRGTMGLDCRATNVIVRKGEAPLTVELNFSAGSSNQVAGRVTDGVWEAPLLGDRAVFDKKSNPSPYKGSYTIIIPGQDDANDGPQGHGFGFIKVDAAGKASFAGVLADGSRLAQRTVLSEDGHWPMYAPLYRGTGSILSWLLVTNRVSDDMFGLMSWIKQPDARSKNYQGGFTNETVAFGSAFVKSADRISPLINVNQPDLVLTGGDLTAPIVTGLIWGEKNKIQGLDDNNLSIRVSPTKGSLRGMVTDPITGQRLKFVGTVLQKQNTAAGFLLGAQGSAKVVLVE
jgi:hypothetical protein